MCSQVWVGHRRFSDFITGCGRLFLGCFALRSLLLRHSICVTLCMKRVCVHPQRSNVHVELQEDASGHAALTDLSGWSHFTADTVTQGHRLHWGVGVCVCVPVLMSLWGLKTVMLLYLWGPMVTYEDKSARPHKFEGIFETQCSFSDRVTIRLWLGRSG